MGIIIDLLFHGAEKDRLYPSTCSLVTPVRADDNPNTALPAPPSTA